MSMVGSIEASAAMLAAVLSTLNESNPDLGMEIIRIIRA